MSASGTLTDNGNIAEIAKEKAEMFNGQFCSDLLKRIWRTCHIKGQSPQQVMRTINIRLSGVIGCVKRLNPRKA